MNASPISMGLLSSRGPPTWHPAGETVRNKCKQAADYCQVCTSFYVLCGSRKYPYSPYLPWKVSGNSIGEGVLKTKLFKGKYSCSL